MTAKGRSDRPTKAPSAQPATSTSSATQRKRIRHLDRRRERLPAAKIAYPEWAGYLAAFQTYADAPDEETAWQAQELMRYFAEKLLPVEREGQAAWSLSADLSPLLEILDTSPRGPGRRRSKG